MAHSPVSKAEPISEAVTHYSYISFILFSFTSMPIMPKRPRSGDSALHSNNASSSSSENKSSRWSFGRFGRIGSGSGSSISGRSTSSPTQSKNTVSPLSVSAVTLPAQKAGLSGGQQSCSSFEHPTQPWSGYQIEDSSYSPFVNGQFQVPSVTGSDYVSDYTKMQDAHPAHYGKQITPDSMINDAYYTIPS